MLLDIASPQKKFCDLLEQCSPTKTKVAGSISLESVWTFVYQYLNLNPLNFVVEGKMSTRTGSKRLHPGPFCEVSGGGKLRDLALEG